MINVQTIFRPFFVAEVYTHSNHRKVGSNFTSCLCIASSPN